MSKYFISYIDEKKFNGNNKPAIEQTVMSQFTANCIFVRSFGFDDIDGVLYRVNELVEGHIKIFPKTT